MSVDLEEEEGCPELVVISATEHKNKNDNDSDDSNIR